MDDKIVPIDKFRRQRPKTIEGKDIQDYVYKHIDFPLPKKTYLVIDEIFADLWNNIPPGGRFDFYDLIDALGEIYEHDILLGDSHLHQIAMYVVEALEKFGHLNKAKL